MASSWGNTRGNGKGAAHMDSVMESENNRMVGNLANKISMLKGIYPLDRDPYPVDSTIQPSYNWPLIKKPLIAIDIDRESKQQNRYIDEMGDDFSSTSGLLSGSAQRLSHMIGAGKSNRTLMCYIITGLVILFLILYYGLGRISR